MHKIKPYFLFLFTIPIVIFTLYSCANKPNMPYPERMSENFSKLEQWNPLLAKEIRKLPEFQDGVTVQEEKALDDLVELYANNPKIFSNAFKQMYQVGKPKVRKYCSPLQALFWLAENNKTKILKLTINSKKPMSAIYYAWGNEDNESTNRFQNKWDNFGIVSDRLNSPQLVHFYINKFITYRGGKRAHGTYLTFKFKKGHCTDAAYFAKDMLKRNGYKTFMRSVRWGPNDWTDVHTGSGIILEDGSYLLVADFGWNNYRNTLSGPFKTIHEVDNILSRGRTVTYRMWGAIFPPP